MACGKRRSREPNGATVVAHWPLPNGATVVDGDRFSHCVPESRSRLLTKKSDHYPLGAIAILLFGGLEKVLHFPRE